MDCDYIFNKLWNNSACKETNLQVPRLHLWLVNADHQKPMGRELEVIVVLEHVQEFGCLTGILKRAQWANDYAIAHVGSTKLEMALWLWSQNVCKNWSAISMPVGSPMWPWWANDHNVAHPHTKIVPVNLIWSESTQWLLGSNIRKILGTLITPMATPMWPQWVNDHDDAHLKAKMVPLHLIWSEYAQWLVSSSIHKVTRMLIMPLGTHMSAIPGKL